MAQTRFAEHLSSIPYPKNNPTMESFTERAKEWVKSEWTRGPENFLPLKQFASFLDQSEQVKPQQAGGGTNTSEWVTCKAGCAHVIGSKCSCDCHQNTPLDKRENGWEWLLKLRSALEELMKK